MKQSVGEKNKDGSEINKSRPIRKKKEEKNVGLYNFECCVKKSFLFI